MKNDIDFIEVQGRLVMAALPNGMIIHRVVEQESITRFMERCRKEFEQSHPKPTQDNRAMVNGL